MAFDRFSKAEAFMKFLKLFCNLIIVSLTVPIKSPRFLNGLVNDSIAVAILYSVAVSPILIPAANIAPQSIFFNIPIMLVPIPLTVSPSLESPF